MAKRTNVLGRGVVIAACLSVLLIPLTIQDMLEQLPSMPEAWWYVVTEPMRQS